MSPIKSVHNKEIERKTNLYSLTFYETHTVQSSFSALMALSMNSMDSANSTKAMDG